MVLYPLAEVGIRMLVAIRIGSSQFVVDVLRDREGRDRQQ